MRKQVMTFNFYRDLGDHFDEPGWPRRLEEPWIALISALGHEPDPEDDWWGMTSEESLGFLCGHPAIVEQSRDYITVAVWCSQEEQAEILRTIT